MTGSRISQLSCWNICSYIICIFLSASIEGTIEPHNISIDIQRPGRVFSPGSLERGNYDHNVHIIWYLRVSDPINTVLCVYPTHMDLETCCDRLTIMELIESNSGNLVSGQITTYTGSQQTPANADSLRRLMQLPPFMSNSGLAELVFHTDSSVAFSGFAIRYFAKHRNIVLPNPYSTIPALSELKQVAVQPEILEFTIDAPFGTRIWLQVVYMNLSTDCRYTTDQLVVYDTFCSMDDCLLASLCRSFYTVTTTTLVTYGHVALVRFSCGQPIYTDCAIINYKLYSESGGGGGGCQGNPTADTYHAIWDSYWLDHSFSGFSHPSELNKTWLFENINAIGEMMISVRENQMVRSPDCSVERLELFRGRCMMESNMITYFCGGVKETYKLTNSRFLMIVFTSMVTQLSDQRQFVLLIRAGNTGFSSPEPDGSGTGQPPGPPENDPYPEWEGWKGFFSLDPYTSIVLLVVAVAIISSLISVWARYNVVKRRQFRHRLRSEAKPTTQETVHSMGIHRKPQHQPQPPPGMPTQNEMYHSRSAFDSGGVPPPAIYNPPPLPHHSQPPPGPVPATPASVHSPMPPYSHQAPGSYSHVYPTARANVVAPYPLQQHIPPPGSVPLHPPPYRPP